MGDLTVGLPRLGVSPGTHITLEIWRKDPQDVQIQPFGMI